jgi:septal ring factor EnvC (AmiA/AmiB activator)
MVPDEFAKDIAALNTEVAVVQEKQNAMESTMDEVRNTLNELSEKVTGLVISNKVFKIVVGLAVAIGPAVGVFIAKQLG